MGFGQKRISARNNSNTVQKRRKTRPIKLDHVEKNILLMLSIFDKPKTNSNRPQI